jgi:glycosyltransferase involved in cell wall biosynthesis
MPLKIAILGTRGIPNNYGGFEHIAGWLGRGFVNKGHEVTVYNSSKHPYHGKEWYGVKIIHCLDPEYLIGIAGQFIYDFNCIRDARKKNFDVILMLGYTSSSVWGFMYPKTIPVITNMDGMEWQRKKYSWPVRHFLKYAEIIAIRKRGFYIADSPVMKKYLDNKYNIKSRYIAYGADGCPVADENLLIEYGLKKYRYFLLMARMEPENNIEAILDGYLLSGTKLKFIVIGNTDNRFGKYLVKKYKMETRIVFSGPIFHEPKVQSLTAFCNLYFHGHSAGGTNPSLLDAMAARVPLAAHDNPFNKYILKDNALYFKSANDICAIINKNKYTNDIHINNNYYNVTEEFNWPKIIDQYEKYIIECHSAGHPYCSIKTNILVH